MTKNNKPVPQLPEALDAYAHRPVARFHMPGHKGRGMGGFFRDELIGWDITELSFSDNLHNPEHVIAQAQDAYAKTCGAAHTFFLVNGATAGLLAMMLSLPPGSAVLMGRDCHRAALSGIALSGHACAFVLPAYCAENDLWGCVTPQAVEKALCRQRADAVLITSPNYYGLCADIPAISEVAHRHGAKLFVDAAHGAHFPFSSSLPGSPAGYADAWVHSAHKTLNALGQAALLHIGNADEKPAMQRALALVQTSSPSYLLLTSLDWARYTASLRDDWTAHTCACRALCRNIAHIPGLRALDRALIGRTGIIDMDATRLTIDVSERGLTGYEAQRLLEAQDVFVEMADQRRLVLISTPSDDLAWHKKLLDALARLPYYDESPALAHVAPPPAAERAVSVAQATRGPIMEQPLPKAEGYIAAVAVGVYPPGIPLWTPGERIAAAHIQYVLEQQSLGADTFGIRNNSVAVVNADIIHV